MKKSKLGFMLAFIMVLSFSFNTFASINGTQNAIGDEIVTVITDPYEIERIMQKENIPSESGEVVEIIKVQFAEEDKQIVPQPFFGNDYYSKLIWSTSTKESTASINYSHPAGVIEFSETYNSSWTLSASGGMKTSVVEAAIGYSLTIGYLRTYKWTSEKYTYPVNVKGYLNYNFEEYSIYERDLFYDDYLGMASTRQDTGYTIVVTKQ